ncbi:sulfotransferase family cytosolic 1B member 1 [Asbolus verrucosus]|uniref:Sulfotransferase family cytosolic 1B member 1 n=1 Tax=Asbolus verrucosus TaxID=1661398 RepID=A0A482VFB1_ASBVE|nr:sulfotransferase family cytosolic 1B member 1 [Asbolus verrucosus]
MVAIVPSEAELTKLLNEKFTCSFRPGYVTVQGFVLPKRYLELEQRIQDFEVFDTDLWICGFPKTGTNWISEIAWLILHDLDYEGAKELNYRRTKTLEQVIYITRNPMDVSISYYHQSVNYEGFSGTLDDLCKLFLFDKINYGPFSKHVLSFWEKRNSRNFLFLKYEDMKRNLSKVIQGVAELLGKRLTDEETARLQEHASFESMKTNPAVNKQKIMEQFEKSGGKIKSPFIRSGKVGGYKSEMPEHFIPQFHYWMKKRFEGSGLDLVNV